METLTKQIENNSLRTLVMRSAWIMAKDAYNKHNIGTIKDYFKECLRLAWKRAKSTARSAIEARNYNKNADYLYSKNSHVFRGATFSMSRNNLVLAELGYYRAKDVIGGRRMHLNAWVRDNKYPKKTEIYKKQLDKLINPVNGFRGMLLSEKQYNMLFKMFYNSKMALKRDANKETEYTIYKTSKNYILLEKTTILK